jgi:hypothetical protein
MAPLEPAAPARRCARCSSPAAAQQHDRKGDAGAGDPQPGTQRARMAAQAERQQGHHGHEDQGPAPNSTQANCLTMSASAPAGCSTDCSGFAQCALISACTGRPPCGAPPAPSGPAPASRCRASGPAGRSARPPGAPAGWGCRRRCSSASRSRQVRAGVAAGAARPGDLVAGAALVLRHQQPCRPGVAALTCFSGLPATGGQQREHRAALSALSAGGRKDGVGQLGIAGSVQGCTRLNSHIGPLCG